MKNDISSPARSQASMKPSPSTEAIPASPESPSEPATLPTPDISDIHDTPPKKKSPKRLLWGLLAALVAFFAVTTVSALLWYQHSLTAVDPGSSEKVRVTIEPGSGVAAIAATLKEKGLIRSEAAFGWYVRQQNKANELKSGVYRLSKAEDVPKIVDHLVSGNTDTFSITFLPGATLAKHRQVLIDAGYPAEKVDAALEKTYDHPLFATKPADADLEGYIYGETYSFPADATPEQILIRTFDQFQSVVESENLAALYQKQGFTLFQGITLASIIQREVATPADAAQVAQVFKLRLDRGMQLGSDVTYQYIADKTGQARSVDLESPYNTRRYTGLPPGPIASPGIDALTAVGSPAPGDYVYFLSGDDDKTYFARTNEEHEQNIRDHCQKKCQII